MDNLGGFMVQYVEVLPQEEWAVLVVRANPMKCIKTELPGSLVPLQSRSPFAIASENPAIIKMSPQ